MLQYKIDLHPGPRTEDETQKAGPNADEVLEYYLRFQEAARLEKHWINERLGWLFTPQAILFAALGFTFSDKLPADQHAVGIIRAWIPIVAIVISLVTLAAVFAACTMHQKWTEKMKEYSARYEAITGKKGVLTFGSKPYWPAAVARWPTLLIPLIFLLAWVVIFVGAGLYGGLPSQGENGGQKDGAMATASSTKPLRVYLASPLGFTEATRFFTENKYKLAIDGITGVVALDPWKDDPAITRVIGEAKAANDLPQRRVKWKRAVTEIGARNARLIDGADGIVAVLDGVDVDSGTAAEIGYGTSKGKWVVGYRADRRRTGEDEAAEVNLQVEYFICSSGGVIVHTLDELVSELKRRATQAHNEPSQGCN